MSVRYKPYSEYKSSGVEWLGDVPKGWDICRIKHFAILNPSKVEARKLNNDTPVTFLPMEAIGVRGELDVSRTKKLEGVINGYTYVAENNVIIAKITPCFENGKGAIANGLENGVAFATTEVIPLGCNRSADSPYLYFLLTSDPFHSLAEGSMYGAGGQKRVSDSFVAEYHFARPPHREREWIASFLDRETGKIDRMIGKQKRMIALLKEKRQAVISHTVTKGLDPNVPMKDSGIEWLGEIPEHWDILSVGKRIVLQRGVDITKDQQSEGKVPVISSGGISSYHNHALIKGPGVVVGRKGTAGSVFYSNCDFWPHDTTLYIKKFIKCQPRYAYYKLLCLDLASFDTGTSNPTVNRNQVHPVKVSWPPEADQKTIVEFLDLETAKIDHLITKAEQAIKLMKERRTALISAAVTGKIDVREEVP